MGTHTNVAKLWMAASALLQQTGRLQEHELWSDNRLHRSFIERDMLACAQEIAEWFGCDLVKREPASVVTILPIDIDEAA